MHIVITTLFALGISLYAVPVVIRIANAIKMYDQPNGRSSALSAVPTLGGVAIFLSFMLSFTIGVDGYILPGLTKIYAALLLMFFVGIKDDILNISAYKKLTAQLITAAILIFYARIRITSLHGFLGIESISPLTSIALTIFVIIVFINAYNLIDGIDGLAAGLGIFACSVFGTWFFLTKNEEFAILSFSLAGALAGFFYYNVYGRKNKIFMGDTGSMVLGTLMAIIVIKFNELNIDQNQPFAIASSPAVSFGILIYPLFDTLRVFSIRILNRRSPFAPDKNHLHHRLLALGFTHKQATYTILISSILFIIPVFYLQNTGILTLLIFNLLLGLFIFTLPAVLIQKRKLIKEGDPYQQIIFPSSSNRILNSINFTENDSPSITVDMKKIKGSKINYW